jgi:hypothetical protein
MFAGRRRLRRIWQNGKRCSHLLLQIGGANIENPPTSSSLAEEKNASAHSSSARPARDSRRSQPKPRAPLAVDLKLLEGIPSRLDKFWRGVWYRGVVQA